MSELGKRILLCRHPADDDRHDDQQRCKVTLNSLCNPQDNRRAEDREHRIADADEVLLSNDLQTCLSLIAKPAEIKVVKQRNINYPI